MASLKRSCVGLGPNMSTMISSEKPRTKASHPAAPVRTLGRGGWAKVRPATDSASPGVDEAEGAEAPCGPRSLRDPAVVHPIR
jgi:hypothetical protein